MGLVFEVTDLQGNVLTEFGQRTNVEVTVGLPQAIGPGKAQLSVSLEDEGTLKVKALSTRLRVYLDGHPLLYGPIGTPRKRYGEGVLDIVAADPGAQLEASYVEVPTPWPLPPTTVDPETGEVLIPPDWQVYGLALPATDQGQILATLVNHARPSTAGIPDHGIGIGSIPASRLRDRRYEPGKQVWGAMLELVQVRAGPDFELRPVLDQGPVCSLLDVYPDGLGLDRSQDAVFVHGAAEANCRDIVEEPQGFATRNRFTSLGQAEQGIAPPFWIANHAQSQLANGTWEGFEGRPDVSEGPTTKEHAEEAVTAAAVPPTLIEVTPALQPGVGEDERYGVPPRFGARTDPRADYKIGDFVRAVASKSGHRTDRIGRVAQVVLTETSSGLVHAKPTLTPLPVAGVTA